MWMSFADGSVRPPKAAQSQAPRGGGDVDEDEFEDEEDVTVADEIGETMTLLMPWAISFMFHFALVLLALFIVWSSSNPPEEDVPVPVSKMAEEVKPKIDPVKTPDIPTVPAVSRKTKSPTVKKGNPLSNPSDATPSDLATIGASGSPSAFGHPDGTDASGVGFMGMGGAANSVIFIVDASGSMVESLPFVMQELSSSIDDLNGRGQKFNVIFYQNNTAIELKDQNLQLRSGLKKASVDNRIKARRWLESGFLIPRGSSSPVKAIEMALKQEPDMIFILSDNITGSGMFAIFKEDLIAGVEGLQSGSGKRVKINTIQFLSEDPLNTLEELAQKNEGQYKFVDAAFVGLK